VSSLSRRIGLVGPLVLVAIGVAAYWGTLDAPFIFDDSNAIVDNPNIRELLPLSRSLSAPDQATVAGRPVAAFSLAVNYAASGLEPWSYHLVNIGIHILAGLLIFGILRRTLAGLAAKSGEAHGPPDRDRLPGSLFALAVAAVWLVHPLQTEVVTYVSTRTESLMALFFLLSLYALIRCGDSRRPLAWTVACITASALAMATKEVAVALPVVLLAYDAVFLSDGPAAGLRRRPALWAGLAATWLILLALVAGGARSETVGLRFADLTPLDYARTQVGVIWHYLHLSVWPHPLVLDYFDWPIARQGSPSLWLAAAVLVVAVLGSLWLVWRRRWLGFIGVWFFAILAPTSSVVPIVSEVAAERRMYLPLAAVVVLVASAAWWSSRRLLPGRRRAILATAAVAVCVALGSLTVARNRVYGSEIGIWRDTIEKRPGNARALENLAVVHVRRGEIERAAGLFRRAIEAAPGFADALEGLGGSLIDLGRRDEGVARLQQALAINPAAYHALENLGLIALDEGRFGDALEMLGRCAILKPDDPLTRLNLAKAHLVAGDLQKALAELEVAVRLAPDNALAQARLALLLAADGRTEEAGEHGRRALDLAPGDAEVRRTVEQAAARASPVAQPDSPESTLVAAVALNREGKTAEAKQALDDLVARTTDNAVLVALAQRCSMGLDRTTAVELLRAAVEARPSEPELYLGLGRVLAASQSDAEALAAYRTALELRPQWTDAANNLALLLATAADPAIRNPEEALRIAREVVAGSAAPHPLLLSTLGVALASTGDRDRADAVLRQAIAAATGGNEREMAAHLERTRALIAGGWPPSPAGAPPPTAHDSSGPTRE
jgi:Tfp pilus assembly protein PilF